MTTAPSVLVGGLIYYVLHIMFGVGFLPTFIVGMLFMAASGYIARRRFDD